MEISIYFALGGLAVIYDGGPYGEAAKVSGVGRQIIRDWVLQLNAEGPSGLIDRKVPGQAPRLKAEHRQRTRFRGWVSSNGWIISCTCLF